MKFVRWFLTLLVLASFAAGAFWLWQSQKVLVDVATVSTGSLVETIEVRGTARATHRTTLIAPVNGVLREIAWNSGGSIQKDEIVATIDPLPPPLLDDRSREAAQARMDAMRAEWKRSGLAREIAQSNLSQVQKRKSSIVVPNGQPRPLTPDLDLEEKARKQELELAERSEEKARYEWNAARAALGLKPEPESEPKTTESKPEATEEKLGDRYDLRAPTDGHVLRVLRRDSGVVSAGTPLVEFGDLSRMEFVFEVLTSEASRLRPGMKITLRNGNFESASWTGAISEIEQSATRQLSPLGAMESRTRVYATTDPTNASVPSIGDGFEVEGTIEVRENANVLKVPLGALSRQDGQWFVFRCKNGRAVQTSVELGAKNDRESCVILGLSEHDLIILYPSSRIQDGTPIAVR